MVGDGAVGDGRCAEVENAAAIVGEGGIERNGAVCQIKRGGIIEDSAAVAVCQIAVNCAAIDEQHSGVADAAAADAVIAVKRNGAFGQSQHAVCAVENAAALIGCRIDDNDGVCQCHHSIVENAAASRESR